MWDSVSPAALRRNRQYRRYLLAGGAVAVVGTLAYRAYQSDAYGRSKAYLLKLRTALQQYTDAAATGGEICATILRDLQTFLASDAAEVPPSLRQVSRLLQSREFTATATSTVEAIYRGVAGPPAPSNEGPQPPSTVDKIIDAFLSDRGHSLVSVAVSMAAKNMVAAYVDAAARAAPEGAEARPDSTDKLFSFLSSPEGQQLAVMAVAAFASNGMRVYMDKSLEVNFYEDMFASMAKPAHLEAVKQCVGVFARDVVGAYLQGGRSSGLCGSDAAGNDGNSGNGELAAVVPAPRAADGGAEAESLAESPSSSAGERIEAVRRLADDLDSDSLLHRRKKGKGGPTGGGGASDWAAVASREWLAVARDPQGRAAVAAVVGSATREAVAGVSSAMVERYSTAVLLAVLLAGVVTAMVLQRLATMLVGV